MTEAKPTRVKSRGRIFPEIQGEGLLKVLLGRQWLKNKRLVVDMASSILTLED